MPRLHEIYGGIKTQRCRCVLEQVPKTPLVIEIFYPRRCAIYVNWLMNIHDIGKRNIGVLRQVLALEGIPVRADPTGYSFPQRM